MTPTIIRRGARRLLFTVAPLAGFGMVAAACGSVGYGNAASTPGNGGGYDAPAGSATSAITGVATRSTKLGEIVTDSAGRTLYLFEQDQGTTSTCTGSCLSAWPAFTTTGSTQAGNGASASLIGTTKRADGKTEVTYAGHPLYYYVGDTQPGDTNGEGLTQFGAGWDVLSPQGTKIEGGQ